MHPPGQAGDGEGAAIDGEGFAELSEKEEWEPGELPQQPPQILFSECYLCFPV